MAADTRPRDAVFTTNLLRQIPTQMGSGFILSADAVGFAQQQLPTHSQRIFHIQRSCRLFVPGIRRGISSIKSNPTADTFQGDFPYRLIV
jgi:hypothetical protein